MNHPPARLWFGRTTHTRMTPFRRSFTHRIAMLEVDIDRLDEADGLSHLFSVERGNVISFRSTDHGARSAAVPLRLWAEARYAEAGIASRWRRHTTGHLPACAWLRLRAYLTMVRVRT